MTADIIIYHNPECGTSRNTLALIRNAGIEPHVVLKDIWNSTDREVEKITRWMVDALIDAALRDASGRKAAVR